MKALFRILGTAAAVAVTGAAIVVLDQILNDKAPLHVEEIEFPEDAENDAEEAAKTAQAYAEGETKVEGEAKAAGETKAEAKPKRRAPTRTPWRSALLLLPKMRTASSTPPRSRKLPTSAIGKSRAARADLHFLNP